MDAHIPSLNQGIGSSYNLPQAPQDLSKKEAPGEELELQGDTFERRKEKGDGGGAMIEGKSRIEGKGRKDTPAPEKEYAILAYMDGSNNLEDCLLDDIKEMESVPKSENYHLATQFSRYHTSPLTTAFLGEALSQGFKSRAFNEVLTEFLGNEQVAGLYRELMKDPGICQRMALILLRRNPALQEKLDKLVESKVRETAQENKQLGDLINETAGEMIGQIGTALTQLGEEAAKKEAAQQAAAQQAAIEGAVAEQLENLLTGQEQPPEGEDNSVETLGISTNLLQIMEGTEPTSKTSIMADLLAATKDFIKSTEGMTAPELMATLPQLGSDSATRDRGSLVFVDTPPGDSKYNHGDFTGLLKQVGGVEINNEPSWNGVKRYELTHDDDPTRINSKPLAFLGYKDMSKVDTLAEFIAWGMKKFPAKHYIVSLSDHGAGFLGAEEDRGSMLSLPDLRAAFEKAEQMTGKKPDVIAFDCCLMQQAEVAYELKDRAKYLVASEEVIGGDGYPYKDVLPAIDQAITQGKTDPGEISKVIIEQAEKANEKSTFTLSAVNLKAIEDVVGAANELADHILQGKALMEDVREALRQTQHFSVSSPMKPYDDFRDIWDMADKLEQHPHITDPVIKKDLKELKKAVENAVIKNEHRNDEDFEGAHGMSIYAPRRQKNVSIPLMEEYGKTKFAQDASKWAEFIKEATDFDALVRKAREEGTDKPKLTFIPLPQRM